MLLASIATNETLVTGLSLFILVMAYFQLKQLEQDESPFGDFSELVSGVEDNRARIDELIAAATEHWKMPRLSRVDLNVLRLATFELLARPEIPAAVTLNEAIEIARRYGSEDSPAFVNGVLDHIAGVLGVRGREGRPA